MNVIKDINKLISKGLVGQEKGIVINNAAYNQ